MRLWPGKSKSFSFSFVAKTEDVGKKIEVRNCVCLHKRKLCRNLRILSYNVFVVNLPIGDRYRGDAGQGVWPLCLFDLERGWGRHGLCS